MRLRSWFLGLFLLAAAAAPHAQPSALAPGARVLLDAHNCYPYEGRFADRIDRALATGLPVAIEQDLIWRPRPGGGGDSVVGHDTDKVADAQTFDAYFFRKVAPVLDQALRDGRRETWPVVVLNLDLKTTEPEHLAEIWRVLGTYERYLTTAPRTATPDQPAPLTPGPLLVLTGSHAEQQAAFHDAVPVGGRLRLFGAITQPAPGGSTSEERALSLYVMSADTLIGPATNYRRWVNFPWAVVEAGGQREADDWHDGDDRRLRRLVSRAHAMGLWIRFYTLNGHAGSGEAEGWFAGYNFGSEAAAAVRWRAARAAKVDFIATDQYEAFSSAK